MAKGNDRPKGTRVPSKLEGALAVAALLLVLAGLLFYLSEENPTLSDIRNGSRAIIGGVALLVGAIVYLRSHVRREDGATDGAPVASQGPSAAPETPAPAPSAEVAGMLAHADDALVALRDLVEHGAGHGDFGALPEFLSRMGLMEWRPAFSVGAARLRRNGRWWLTLHADELTEDDVDRAMALEFALNLNDDLARRDLPRQMTDAWRVARVLAEVSELKPLEVGADPAVELLLSGSNPAGEWAGRIGFARYLEGLPAPFRVGYVFQSNPAERVACVETTVPRPECFAVVAGENVARRRVLARAYALRISLAVGRGALSHLTGVERVVVNAHAHASEDILLSLDLTTASLQRLRAAVRSDASLDESLPSDPALRAAPEDEGWLAPVEPWLSRQDEQVAPPARRREPELVDAPATEDMARSCGARRVSDLSIMERAGRVSAWNAILHELGDTTQEAVSRLMALRDETSDPTVAEACSRACTALVDGTCDVSEKRELAWLFVSGDTLSVQTRRAREALEGEVTPDDLERAREGLERVLSPIAEEGLYLDSADTVFRYFNSVAERVSYNRSAPDGGCVVRLVPDEYYTAHSTAARVLTMLGRHEEALAHAEELMRVAPLTPDAALSKVRCLEEQSRIFEAADLLRETIARSSTVRDMAICHYRLAFMEWKLGRSDLAVACYQRAIELHPEVAAQARSELSDLLQSEPSLKALKDEEVAPALETAGIPLGNVDGLYEVMRDAARSCADAGVFSVARPLASVLLEMRRDDVLLGVYASLA